GAGRSAWEGGPGSRGASGRRRMVLVLRGRPRGHHRIESMKLQWARAIVDVVVTEAPGPVSVFVSDGHGELVAAATMDGAPPDTEVWPRCSKRTRVRPVKSGHGGRVPKGRFWCQTP